MLYVVAMKRPFRTKPIDVRAKAVTLMLAWDFCVPHAEMGQIEAPNKESHVLEEATEYLIQESIRLGDDEEDLDEERPQLDASSVAASEPERTAAELEGPQAGRSGTALTEARAAPTAEQKVASSSPMVDSMADSETELLEDDGGSQPDLEVGQEMSEAMMADMAMLTTRQSSTWGRIIRPPRKKGRHVIVDLCAPLAALPKHRQAELLTASQRNAQGNSRGFGMGAFAHGHRAASDMLARGQR
jgi:hypothetical protein